MKKIIKVLIANRGEIALRIMRTLKEMEISTVAVYSEADRNSPHVIFADEAVFIGPPTPTASYLNQEKIIQAAIDTKSDAIHPGYGFLSENAGFARKVNLAGLIFIGPSPESIEIMGSKLAAKDAAAKFNIPMVPGGDKAISSVDEAKTIAEKVGYPVLIKASAGGGGKGMRIVESPDQLKEQMERAVSEAVSSFGDGSVFIEKYISSPKHIEIQILGDQTGNIIHLFERECSVQRRYQKVVEEAPSAVVNDEMREAMGKAAIDVARSCNYYGAGTVEFIVDEKRNFYFLEMNTRLQVEHPVTEMITGIDLVREQIRIASGKNLSVRQEELSINGHSIELRVYAEDPINNFLPDTGKLFKYRRPQGPGVRIDDGFEEGMDVPVFYDPMIAKLIVHAPDRQTAIRKMLRAIDEYIITGVSTTLPFGKFVLEHASFQDGSFDTHFVNRYFHGSYSNEKPTEEELKIAAAVSAIIFKKEKVVSSLKSTQRRSSSWKNRRK